MTQQVIKILIADDHDMVRKGIGYYLETIPEFTLVGEASNGREAVQLCAELRPDVVLMDIEMPVMNGIDATAEITQQLPHTKVLMLTSFKEKVLIQQSLRAGAVGYILKNIGHPELTNAVRTAHQGHSTISSEVAQILVTTATEPETENYNLTERELEIIEYLAKGLTNSEIGQELYLSPYTIKTYVSRILSKLGVSSRSEAVALALRENLIR